VEPKALLWELKRCGREGHSIGIPKHRKGNTPLELIRSHRFLGFFFMENYAIIKPM